MNDITSILDDILTDRCLVSLGNIDTFTEEAIEVACQFLGDCGVPFTYEYIWDDNIVVFSWIEYNKPQIFMFKVK